MTGIQGPTGAKGTTGAQGPTGAKGMTGIQGPTGAKGMTGIQGPTGMKGMTGPIGPSDVYQVTNGPAGAPFVAVSGTTISTATVSCFAGDKVAGGGYLLSPPVTVAAIVQNSPDLVTPATTWNVTAITTGTLPVGTMVITTITCIDLTP